MPESSAAPTTEQTIHPLEPLRPEEISRAAALLREAGKVGERTHFLFIALRDPDKRELGRWEDGEPGAKRPPRLAFLSTYDGETRLVAEAIVSLGDETVLDYTEREGMTPSLVIDDIIPVEEIIKEDPRFVEAMRRRGVEDVSLMMVEAWPSGHADDADDRERGRLLRPLFQMRAHPEDNPYGQPIEGLTCVFDLDTMSLIEFTDHGIVPLPEYTGDYLPEALERESNWPHTEIRDDVKPLEITQPQGPSFELDGNLLRWQGWQLRVGFTPREGLVLEQLGYEDKGRLRSVLHRASLAEMYVPYGDVSPTQLRKNVFDGGEAGLGILAEQLVLGCDCLGEIRYLDATINDPKGEPAVLKNAICIHEEDAGTAWKHRNIITGIGATRRMRRLVVSSVYMLANYVYGIYWHLYQDGSIECDLRLTGIVTATGFQPGTRPRHGTVVAPGIYAPNHQHFFCVRMDMAIDGFENSVYEVDSVLSPEESNNPFGTAWEARPRLLERESVAASTIDSQRGRYWRVANDNVKNAFGDSVGYRLEPGSNVFPISPEDSFHGRRGAFTRNHLWVTAHDPAQLYAAGDYPWQNPRPEGLPAYVKADRPLVNSDVVLWYVMGAHHVPRAEEWPVMSVAHLGFMLKPDGFFDHNPAINLPPEPAECAHRAHG